MFKVTNTRHKGYSTSLWPYNVSHTTHIWYSTCHIDWCYFYCFVRNSLVALLEDRCVWIFFFRFVNIGFWWFFFFLFARSLTKPFFHLSQPDSVPDCRHIRHTREIQRITSTHTWNSTSYLLNQFKKKSRNWIDRTSLFFSNWMVYFPYSSWGIWCLKKVLHWSFVINCGKTCHHRPTQQTEAASRLHSHITVKEI